MDELTPLSCSGHGPDWDEPYAINYFISVQVVLTVTQCEHWDQRCSWQLLIDINRRPRHPCYHGRPERVLRCRERCY